MDARNRGLILGVRVTRHIAITHLMFVDDLLFGGETNLDEWLHIHKIIYYYFFW